MCTPNKRYSHSLKGLFYQAAKLSYSLKFVYFRRLNGAYQASNIDLYIFTGENPAQKLVEFNHAR